MERARQLTQIALSATDVVKRGMPVKTPWKPVAMVKALTIVIRVVYDGD